MKTNQKPQSHPGKYVGWIALGNFLENYDFALYIHFASILSFLFFPPYFNPDETITFSFTITLFCSLFATFVWGKIADLHGRKVPLVWSCIIASGAMCLIPIQASIFEKTIFSALFFCFLRGCVDFALTGEYLSTNIYITESYPQKKASFYSALVDGICNLGVIAGLLTSVFCLRYLGENGWMYPFFIGGSVAIIAAFTRKKVQESLDFQMVTIQAKEISIPITKIWRDNLFFLKKIIAIETLFGFGFFFVYLYLPKFLIKGGYTPEEILWNNMFVALIQGIACVFYGFLSLKVYALTITKVRSVILLIWSIFLLFTFSDYIQDPHMVFVVQGLTVLLALDHIPAIPIFLKAFPIITRARSFNTAFCLGKNLMYVFTAFFIYSIEEVVGHMGVIAIFCAVILLFIWGVFTFLSKKIDTIQYNANYTY